jgi:membrane-bound lytic murein transglycosylase D
MKATAQIYGLKLNHWVDERRDPVKSTIAAARYLKDMYVKFGDWYLAMASYNAGPGKISRAIRKTGSRDFWKISQTNYLKAETKHYVPKVLAAAILASNPQAHGFDVTPDPQDRPPNGQVFLTRPLKLDDLATKLQVPSKQITKWNPELLRDITPPINIARGESYPLRLPIELLERFNEVSTEIAYLEVEDVTLHKIKPGETLTSIAKKYGAPAQHIKSVNPDLNVRALKIGRQVAIPVPNVRSH